MLLISTWSFKLYKNCALQLELDLTRVVICVIHGPIYVSEAFTSPSLSSVALIQRQLFQLALSPK